VLDSLRATADLVDGQHRAAWTPAMMSGHVTTRAPIEDDRQSDSRVFVIDGNMSVREALEPLIRTAGSEPESFASAEEFLSHPRGSVPCCVILDLVLPGLSGLDLQKQLAGRRDMPLIFIASHTDVPAIVQAMKAGAVEFFTKPLDDVALLHAMRTAIGCSRATLRHDSEMRMLASCYSSLTPRERQVMALVVSGLLNKQIGSELGISEITVKAHRGQVMRKMEAVSLPHLVTMAAQLGWRDERRLVAAQASHRDRELWLRQAVRRPRA
jgi:FixJ family two-component response regulator